MGTMGFGFDPVAAATHAALATAVLAAVLAAAASTLSRRGKTSTTAAAAAAAAAAATEDASDNDDDDTDDDNNNPATIADTEPERSRALFTHALTRCSIFVLAATAILVVAAMYQDGAGGYLAGPVA